MVRTPTVLSPNRSLVVLLVLLIATLAGVAAARELVGASFQPAAPMYAPAEDSATIAPGVEATSAPIPVSDPATSPLPATRTAAPAPAAPVPAAPAATTLPRPTVPVGPATTAAPGHDIPAIAPELGVPGFTPPPGRE